MNRDLLKHDPMKHDPFPAKKTLLTGAAILLPLALLLGTTAQTPHKSSARNAAPTMQRPLAEVLASQDVMLHHGGTAKPSADNSVIAGAFEKNLRAVNAWLDSKAYVKTLRVSYHDVLRDAEVFGQKLAEFLEISLNVEAMTRQVDATLYRNRCR